MSDNPTVVTIKGIESGQVFHLPALDASKPGTWPKGGVFLDRGHNADVAASIPEGVELPSEEFEIVSIGLLNQ